MGGMNLAVRNGTGKDPDAYLSDYRNRNNARMQAVSYTHLDVYKRQVFPIFGSMVQSTKQPLA